MVCLTISNRTFMSFVQATTSITYISVDENGGYGCETLKDMRKKSLWKTKGNLPAELERLQK